MVGQWDPNIVFITVPLKHWDERNFSQQEIINKIRQPLGNIPGAPAYPGGANSLNLRGQGGGIEIALLGQDYLEIFKAAQQFSADLEKAVGKLEKRKKTEKTIRTIIGGVALTVGVLIGLAF